jgi:phosphate transport system substrate-binding protein
MRRMFIIACLFPLFAQSGAAETPELPPTYVPQQQVAGTIRIWGHGAFGKKQDFMETLTHDWETGFQKVQPRVHFETNLYGTASAIGALYTGRGDIAFMGREIWPNEIAGYREVFHRDPAGMDIVTGSFDVRNHGYAVVFFVHKDNPVSCLTLKQLDALFSADRRRGGAEPRTWGDLGATGDFASRPIHLYGLPIARGFAEYVEEAVFKGSRKWNAGLQEFSDMPGSRGGETDGGQMMLGALAKDPDGIGYAGLPYQNPETKALSVSQGDGEPYVAPTKESVLDHTYPLTRMITAYFNRSPEQPPEPAVREFLRYVLSREAQSDVLRDGGGYLPMLAPFAARERQKLD